MKNLWVQRKAEIATWFGDLSTVAEDPAAIRALLEQIVVIGIATGIVEVDLTAVRAALDVTWAQERRLDVRVIAHHKPRARVCWHDGRGGVVSGDVDDLGRLLRSLESVDRYTADLGSAPVEVTGSSFRYQDGRLVPILGGPSVAFTTYSDIWFPFVTGDARYFDNRDLANRHTPRLNAYLDAVASAVIAAGGRWEVEHDCVAHTLAPWVTEHGIRLDGPVPPLMPPELVDVPWPSDDDA